MKRYEEHLVPIQMKVLVEATCDGCQISEEESESGYLTTVLIQVGWGDTFGASDEYHYCNTCLVERAEILEKVGSTSLLIVDEEDPEHDE